MQLNREASMPDFLTLLFSFPQNPKQPVTGSLGASSDPTLPKLLPSGPYPWLTTNADPYGLFFTRS